MSHMQTHVLICRGTRIQGISSYARRRVLTTALNAQTFLFGVTAAEAEEIHPDVFRSFYEHFKPAGTKGRMCAIFKAGGAGRDPNKDPNIVSFCEASMCEHADAHTDTLINSHFLCWNAGRKLPITSG